MQYLKHQILGRGCIEDKDSKTLEKKSIKEWAYAIHDKDPRSSHETTAISTARRHRGTLAIPKPVHIKGY